MAEQERLRASFRVVVDYPESVREFISSGARRASDKPGCLFDDVLWLADEAAITFYLGPTFGFGEEGGTVFGIVHGLVAGVPAILRGEGVVVHGMYQALCFEPDMEHAAVHLSRGRREGSFEEEEELRRELGAPVPDVKETARPPVESDERTRDLEWRRLESSIPLQQFVEQCLCAGAKTIEFYRRACPPEMRRRGSPAKLISFQARARRAWEAFRNSANSGNTMLNS